MKKMFLVLLSLLFIYSAHAAVGVLHEGEIVGQATSLNIASTSEDSFDGNTYTIDAARLSDLMVGSSTDRTVIENDGSIYQYGEATSFEDLRFPAASLKGGSAAPSACVMSGSILASCFSGTNPTPDEVHGQAQFPHAMRLNSTIFPHIHWGPSTSAAGNVVWQLEFSCADVGGTFPASGTISVSQAAGGVGHKHQIASLPSIDTSLYGGLSGICAFRLFRETSGADTYAADAELYEFDIHYEQNTPGSRQEYVK